MKNILIVIAGLVEQTSNPTTNIDAISTASRTVKNSIYAYTTSEIAYEMKNYLEDNNCSADIISADSILIDLTKYDLIIIGSGIYGGSHPAAKKFIQTNENNLDKRKVALFAVCGMLCSDSEKIKQKARKIVDNMVFGLSPVSKTVFCGRVRDMGYFGNWIGKIFFKSKPVGDYRDWNLIKEWTLSLLKVI